MIPSLLADIVTVIHFGFVLFVGVGGALVLRYPRVAWLHVPAFAWGALISFAGWVCPLTPLENHLRREAGEAGIGRSFVEHYILPILYPGALTREIQVMLGVGVLLVNAGFYGVLIWRRRRRRGGDPAREAR